MPTATYTSLDVAIIGAGLGGLATAIALRRAGHHCTIYEKRDLAAEVGNSISCAKSEPSPVCRHSPLLTGRWWTMVARLGGRCPRRTAYRSAGTHFAGLQVGRRGYGVRLDGLQGQVGLPLLHVVGQSGRDGELG